MQMQKCDMYNQLTLELRLLISTQINRSVVKIVQWLDNVLSKFLKLQIIFVSFMQW